MKGPVRRALGTRQPTAPRLWLVQRRGRGGPTRGLRLILWSRRAGHGRRLRLIHRCWCAGAPCGLRLIHRCRRAGGRLRPVHRRRCGARLRLRCDVHRRRRARGGGLRPVHRSGGDGAAGERLWAVHWRRHAHRALLLLLMLLWKRRLRVLLLLRS